MIFFSWLNKEINLKNPKDVLGSKKIEEKTKTPRGGPIHRDQGVKNY